MYEWREVFKLSEQEIADKASVQDFLKLFETDSDQAKNHLIDLANSDQRMVFVEIWLGLLSSVGGNEVKNTIIFKNWRDDPKFEKAVRKAFGQE